MQLSRIIHIEMINILVIKKYDSRTRVDTSRLTALTVEGSGLFSLETPDLKSVTYTYFISFKIAKN